MRPFQDTPIFLIGFSFLSALILTIVPMPDWAVWLRPQWVFAVLLFWLITPTEQCGVTAAWFIGLGMDLITGTPVGLQAFVYVALAYFVLRSRLLIAHLPILQQASVIGLLVFLNGFMQGILLSWLGHSSHIGLHALPAITTGLIWPWFFSILDHLRPRALIR
jgi:rod shape-determining protein MreD